MASINLIMDPALDAVLLYPVVEEVSPWFRVKHQRLSSFLSPIDSSLLFVLHLSTEVHPTGFLFEAQARFSHWGGPQSPVPCLRSLLGLDFSLLEIADFR